MIPSILSCIVIHLLTSEALTPLNNTSIRLAITDHLQQGTTYGPISQWDTSQVTDMTLLFNGDTSFNAPLQHWNVSTVTTMKGMFYNSRQFNQDLSQWDVSNVTTMSHMFVAATSFHQDVSTWVVSKVQDMRWMFYRSQSFDSDIHAWDVSRVTDMQYMFYDASAFNQPLNRWEVGKVTNMEAMFWMTSQFDQTLNAWDVSKVRSMLRMFQGTTSFQQELCWDMSHVDRRRYMFDDQSNGSMGHYPDCIVGPTITPTSFPTNTPSISMSPTLHPTNLPLLTNDNLRLAVKDTLSGGTTYGPISHWDTSHITNMSTLFFEATSFHMDLHRWNVSQVTEMAYMFFHATDFDSDLRDWDVSNVRSMRNMFYRARSFNSNISHWDVSKVTDMSYMFYMAREFEQVLEWRVLDTADVDHMFKYSKGTIIEPITHAPTTLPTHSPISLPTSLPTTLPTHPPTSCGDHVTFDLTIQLDEYPLEVSWSLHEGPHMIQKRDAGYYTLDDESSLIQESICVDLSKCYTFQLMDSWGDGLCCGGFYEVVVDGVEVAVGDQYGPIAEVSFGVCRRSETPSKSPSMSLSQIPFTSPSDNPFTSPSQSPSMNPSDNPFTSPSQSPSMNTSTRPSMNPSTSPSAFPVIPIQPIPTSPFQLISSLSTPTQPYCLSPSNNTLTNDIELAINPCQTSTTFQWTITQDGTLHNYKDSNMCITMTGRLLSLKPCVNASIKQRWVYSGNFGRLLFYQNNNRAMTVMNTVLSSNAPVKLIKYTSDYVVSLSQVWEVMYVSLGTLALPSYDKFRIVSGLSNAQDQWCLYPTKYQIQVDVKLSISTCEPWIPYQWSWDMEGKLSSIGDPTICITRLGSRLQLETCQNGTKEQRWTYSVFDKKLITVVNGRKQMTVEAKVASIDAQVKILPGDLSGPLYQIWDLERI